MNEVAEALNAALEAGYRAMDALDSMPRGPYLDYIGGAARGCLICRACLYAGVGKLLVRRRAAGRHLRMHMRTRRSTSPGP